MIAVRGNVRENADMREGMLIFLHKAMQCPTFTPHFFGRRCPGWR